MSGRETRVNDIPVVLLIPGGFKCLRLCCSEAALDRSDTAGMGPHLYDNSVVSDEPVVTQSSRGLFPESLETHNDLQYRLVLVPTGLGNILLHSAVHHATRGEGGDLGVQDRRQEMFEAYC